MRSNYKSTVPLFVAMAALSIYPKYTYAAGIPIRNGYATLNCVKTGFGVYTAPWQFVSTEPNIPILLVNTRVKAYSGPERRYLFFIFPPNNIYFNEFTFSSTTPGEKVSMRGGVLMTDGYSGMRRALLANCPPLNDDQPGSPSDPNNPPPPPPPDEPSQWCYDSAVYWHEVPCSTSTAPTGTDEASKISWGFGIGSDYLS